MDDPAKVPSADELNEMLKKVVDLAGFKTKASGTSIMYEVHRQVATPFQNRS